MSEEEYTIKKDILNFALMAYRHKYHYFHLSRGEFLLLNDFHNFLCDLVEKGEFEWEG